MEFNNDIICIDQNGHENKFKYSLEESLEDGKIKWIFRVVPFNLTFSDWFELSIIKINNENGKINTMNNRGISDYVAKGIPEKLIEEANAKLNLIINSSSNNKDYKTMPNEWRTDAATKVWIRLLNLNKAKYDSIKDIYTFLP